MKATQPISMQLEQGIPERRRAGTVLPGPTWRGRARLRAITASSSLLWCNERWPGHRISARQGRLLVPGAACPHSQIAPGQKLPDGHPDPYSGQSDPGPKSKKSHQAAVAGPLDPHYTDFHMQLSRTS